MVERPKPSAEPEANHIYAIIALANKPMSRERLWQLLNVPRPREHFWYESFLENLIASGKIIEDSKKRLIAAAPFSKLMIVKVLAMNSQHRTMLTEPVAWDNRYPKPTIEIDPRYYRGYLIKPDDRLLVRIRRTNGLAIGASIVQDLNSTKPARITGTFQENGMPSLLFERNKLEASFDIRSSDKENFYKPGDLVVATIKEDSPQNYPQVHVEGLMFKSDQDMRRLSDLVLVNKGIQTQFPAAIEQEAEQLKGYARRTKDHEDLTHIPFVTIDGVDARDFDDAIAAMPDTDPDNPGGWHVWVAVADVAYYVRPESALDLHARKRGFSIYLPDRAVHMLPEVLAENICSLKPDVKRHAMVLHMRYNDDGERISFEPHRGIIQSRARLTYDQVDRFFEGDTSVVKPGVVPHLKQAQEVYHLIQHGMGARDELEITKPKIVAVYDSDGRLERFEEKHPFEAHHLIETFMIEANMAVAACLADKDADTITRVHCDPDPKDIERAIRNLRKIGLSVKDDFIWHPSDLNDILMEAMQSPALYHQTEKIILNMIRPAEYEVRTIGHYGLDLSFNQPYTHFTSPIRRYSDLIVHRSLISAYNLGPGGIDEMEGNLHAIAAHLNDMQLFAKKIQLESLHHHDMAFFSRHVGQNVDARIMSISPETTELKLDGSPLTRAISTRDFLPLNHYNVAAGKLVHRHTNDVIENDSMVSVRVLEADPIRDEFSLKISNHPDLENKPRPKGRRFHQPARAVHDERRISMNKIAMIDEINTTSITLRVDGHKEPVKMSLNAFLKGSVKPDGQGVYVYDAQKSLQRGDAVNVRLEWATKGAKDRGGVPLHISWLKNAPPQNAKTVQKGETFHSLRDLQILLLRHAQAGAQAGAPANNTLI